jgi:hypothetical protein
MIVDHKWYTIGNERDTGGFRGFGGSKFTFDKNLTIIDSTNVWFGGDIPKHFWDRIPNNAIMVVGDPPIDMSKL